MQHKLISVTNWFAADTNRVKLALLIGALLVMALTTGAVFAGEATSGS
jgi:hypothetical protein